MKRTFVCLVSVILLLTFIHGAAVAETEGSTIDRDALIGVWTFSVEPDQSDDGLLVLNEDGTCQLGMIDFSFTLQWVLEGDALILKLPGESETALQMQVVLDGDCLTVTEESGAVTEFVRADSLPENKLVAPDSEAEVFLGEWDMYLPYGEDPQRMVFNGDGTVEIHTDLDGSDIVFRIRWNYEDGRLYFPMTSTYYAILETSDGWLQVAFEGERIVLIEDVTLNDMVTSMGLGFDSRYVYVLTRPDNPLTEEEYQALQEKYALPEVENTEAE